MNPLTLVKRTQKINLTEAALDIKDEASWHAKYKDSAYIFIGGIPFDLTEGDLLAVFAQYGEVVDVNLVRDKATGKSKGFAFLAYEDQRSTILAVDNLNGAKILGRIVRVDHVSNYKKKEEEEEDEEERQVFDKLAPKGVVTWSAMIRTCSAHGRVGDALSLFDEMREQGLRPNAFTYTSVLAACSHGGLVEEGMMHLDGMRVYGLTPTLEHCTCVVDLLGRAGRLVEAYEFVKGMALEPDVGVWGALLGACRIHGELEMAEAVAEELSRRLGCRNATVYVLMANMYAEAGRWEEAERVRERMREMELRKDPGCSFFNSDKRPNSLQRTSSMQHGN